MDRLRALQDEQAGAERKVREKSLARALRARVREKGRR